MTDTPLQVAELVKRKMMARSGSERFIMGARMFDAARAMVVASLPPDLSPEEARRRLYERIYGERPPF
jgi:hypothetical protein